ELYGPAPTLEDPVGSEVKTGREEVEAFYRSVENLEKRINLREFRASGDNAAAFAFDIDTKVEGATMTVSAIEVMTFDEDGKIASMKAYWHPEHDVVLG